MLSHEKLDATLGPILPGFTPVRVAAGKRDLQSLSMKFGTDVTGNAARRECSRGFGAR
jgi:hypothetical protein